jgi:hypothetical protein
VRLTNVAAAAPPAELAALASRLRALYACAGASCN